MNSTVWQSICSDSTPTWTRALRASAQLKEYFVGILADRRREPRDDMVTVLAAADIDGVRMSDEQIYGFMRNLLPAGAETTSRSTASLAFGLLTHPDQLAAVVGDRGLLPQAIEEGIRWETPLLNFMRETTCDVDFHGVHHSGGLDGGCQPRQRQSRRGPLGPSRRRFDIFRERKPHIGFGHGAHVCLGMHLARLESTMIFNTLFDRLPGLRLDPDAPDAVCVRHVLPVAAPPQRGLELMPKLTNGRKEREDSAKASISARQPYR